MDISRRKFIATAAAAPLLATVPPARAETAHTEHALPFPLDQLDTPALLIDQAAYERNLKKMAGHLRQHGVGLRPHAKTHKSAHIAKQQLAEGAVGICCAKISEAEALAREGIGPILITSPVTTPGKVERFIRLARENPERMLAVDSRLGVDLLHQAAKSAGIKVKALLDLDVGTGRTGVPCGEDALEMARYAVSKTSIAFMGVQAYAGHLMHVNGFEERRRRSLEALQAAVNTRAALEASGIPCPLFTGGGTGTFDIDIAVPGITDLQCGSYLFMDVQYRIIGGPQSTYLDTFEPALFVLSTAISKPLPGRVTIDAGYKALTNENVAPQWLDRPEVRYSWGGDEHGLLRFAEGEPVLALGESLQLFTAHCDPTVNLYDTYHVVRDGQVVERWPVTARGCSQ